MSFTSNISQFGVVVGASATEDIKTLTAGTTGQIFIGNTGTDPSWLAGGTTGQILTATTGASPSWAPPATSGTVTSVSGTANQVSVANGTTTPVISLVGPYTPSTFTAHGVLIGEGTSSIVALSAGSAGQVLQSGGASADPAYSTATYPSVATGTGTLLRADGTNWVATTSTYPNTNAVNTLLYASSANVMAALATANSGVLTTDASGVPSIDTTNFAVLTTGVQMKGNNTNTAPPAGFIGEQIRSAIGVGSEVTLSHTVTANVTSISLTAGIWDISGIVSYRATNTNTTNPATISSISATSATSGTGGDNAVNGTMPSTSGTVNTAPTKSYTIPAYRVTLSGTTTYYLTAYAQATVTFGCTAYGRISATRVG